MVKRAKLTLNHTEAQEHVAQVEESDNPEPVETEQSVAPDRQNNLGKVLIIAGLTIVSLIIFRQKFI